jgi:hypothetical protein
LKYLKNPSTARLETIESTSAPRANPPRRPPIGSGSIARRDHGTVPTIASAAA